MSQPATETYASHRRVVVVPDLHGRLDMLEQVIRHYPEAHYLILGDVIDRGPRSLATVERALQLRREGRATLLMGNHERMAQEGLQWFREYQASREMAHYKRAIEGFQWWMRAGGETVRREVPALTLEQFPPLLSEYLEDLPRVVYVTADGAIHRELPSEPSVLVSHAAPPVKHPQYPNPLSAALWLRPFEGPFPLASGVTYSVHGHTPVRGPTRLHKHIYLDLGTYQTGRLAVLEVGDPTAPPRITVFVGPGRPEMREKYVRFGERLPAEVVEEARLVMR